MITLFAVLAVSLALSFLCSILEAVLLSVSHSYVVVLQERKSRAGALLGRMRENIDEPIAAILTLNTIAHTVGAALGGALALRVFGDAWIALFSAVLTLVILVFSEILPKTLGASYWRALAPPAAYVLSVLVVLLRPVLAPLAWFNRLISPHGARAPKMSRAELEVLAEIGRREGVIDQEECRVVTKMINLDSVRAGDVMTPRIGIVAVEVDEGLAGAKRLVQEKGHSRLPVYRRTLDDIVGIVLARDLWRACEEGVQDLREVMRKPRFVPESKLVVDLTREMRAERIRLVILVDEFGGTAGLLTLEDLIEEIVGEMRDEHDLEPLPFEELGSGEVRIAGTVPVWEVNERYGLDLPSDEYATVGGFVFGVLGRLPETNAEVAIPGGRLRVTRMEGRRISRVSFIRSTAAPG